MPASATLKFDITANNKVQLTTTLETKHNLGEPDAEAAKLKKLIDAVTAFVNTFKL